jgi:hypothetical protein
VANVLFGAAALLGGTGTVLWLQARRER